jgi:hypothetical protein
VTEGQAHGLVGNELTTYEEEGAPVDHGGIDREYQVYQQNLPEAITLLKDNKDVDLEEEGEKPQQEYVWDGEPLLPPVGYRN